MTTYDDATRMDAAPPLSTAVIERRTESMLPTVRVLLRKSESGAWLAADQTATTMPGPYCPRHWLESAFGARLVELNGEPIGEAA